MRGGRRALLACLALGLLASTPAAWGASDQEIRDRAREVVADPDYQKDLDHDRDLEELLRKRQRDGSTMVRRGSGTRRAPADSGGTDIGGGLMIVLLVVLGVAVALFVAIEVRRAMWRRQRMDKPVVVAGGETDEATGETLPATLARARELARAGQHEEAIHVLLQGAVAYVAHLARFDVDRAMTSREVLRGANLDPEARDAFRELVMSVEVSLFGGADAGPEDFDRCAAAFGYLHGRLHA